MKKLLPILLLSLFACTKHSGDVTDDEQVPTATLSIASPTANASYHNGDTVWLRATALSTATIHGYTVQVRPAGDTTALFTATVHDHNDTLNINQYWVNNRTAPASLEARFLLTLDHDGHTLEKLVPIQVQ